jgi:CHAT domain-containing protein
MKVVLKLAVVAGVISGLSGCQTNSVSIDEARDISLKLQGVAFTAPARSINNIRIMLGKVREPRDISCSRHAYEPGSEKLASFLATLPRHPTKGNGVIRLQKFAREEFFSGNYLKSIKFLEQALSRLPSKVKGGRANRLSQLVRYYAEIGDFQSAEIVFSKMKGYYNRTKYQDNWRTYYENFGSAAMEQSRGNLVQAELHYRKALAAMRLEYSLFNEDMVASDLAENLAMQGRLNEAEALSRNAVKHNTERHDKFTARSLSQLSRILYEQAHYEDAQYLAHWAITILIDSCADADSVALNSARHAKARALIGLGKWDDALYEFDKIREAMSEVPTLFESRFGADTDWGIALLKTGRAKQAENMFSAAYDITKSRLGPGHYQSGEMLGLLSTAQASRGDAKTALSNFSKAVNIVFSGTNGNGDGVTNLSIRSSRIKMIADGYLMLLSSPEGQAAARAAGIDSKNESFRIAGATLSRSVQHALAESTARSKVSDPELAKIVRQEQDAKHKISALAGMLSKALSQQGVSSTLIENLNNNIAQLRSARAAFTAQINSNFPEYSALLNPKPTSVEQVKSTLMPGQALMMTYVAENRTYVWAVKKQGDISFSSVEVAKDKLSDQVAHLRTSLAPDGISSLGDLPEFDVSQAYSIYKQIMLPVESGWKTEKDLVVIADGPLAQLPFSLLPTKPYSLSQTSALMFDEYRTVPWLARSHSVTVLPSVASLQALQATATTTTERRPFVGFGDPFFSSIQAFEADKEQAIQVASNTGTRGIPISLRSVPNTRAVDSATLSLLPRLPDSRPEIQAIAKVLGADPAQDIYLGREASEQNVKTKDLSGYKVISFATHGLVSGDLNGLNQPALALSSPDVTGNKNNDGLLTMGEVLGLKLNADWVVLSACNTASGDGQGAEAISGLGRAFFYAGSRALLVSNWPVHSAATTELMTTLFEKQANDNTLNRAEALRQTRIDLIDNAVFKTADGKAAFSYAHPIFWAPFTIVGDGGS